MSCNICYLLLAELYACHSALGFAKVSLLKKKPSVDTGAQTLGLKGRT